MSKMEKELLLLFLEYRLIWPSGDTRGDQNIIIHHLGTMNVYEMSRKCTR